MPRLSQWKKDQSVDYHFHDRIIREQFHVGGLGVICHKYIGPEISSHDDATLKGDDHNDEITIQDMVFLENRDRKYDKNLFEMYGIYNVADNDFDLSVFALILTADTLYMSFHLNEMVEIMGRKLMNGDVLEFPNVLDYYGLSADTPPIPKYYVVQDGNFASEGFSQTWRPHIWRVKVGPIPDSQEFKNIVGTTTDDNSIKSLFSTYDKTIDITNAVVTTAAENDPLGGVAMADHLLNFVDESKKSFFNPENIPADTEFPMDANQGDFLIRTDFNPHRLFRYSGKVWVRMYDRINDVTWEDNTFNASTFINNKQTDMDRAGEYDTRQPLSKIFKDE